MVSVYGVRIEGAEGRAGMAALLLDDEQREHFDGEAFYTFVDGRLPRYAAPVFVRLVSDADVTGTFKLRKIELQREGFDLAQIGDPVWLRDDEAKTYVPLTRKLQRQLLSGELRP
jgi:fatty-acyl-CoA synthase